ncbi:hypothetical protein [Ferrimicrobium sp.]|uniref:hypothetical protein n=1 Tax=Ferrimicrobium sp. TaxID=2926050 RepID=UPI00260314BF|nr:hypothetical protein [Ferrimicrobium sp.]
MHELRDGWQVGVTSDAVITWPVPAVGSLLPSVEAILGQVMICRRRFADLPCKVVLPSHASSRNDQRLVTVEDFNSVFATAVPGVEVLTADRSQVQRLRISPPPAAVVTELLPPWFKASVDRVFGSVARPEFVWYRGSVFAEYLGIPVLGVVDESLVAGVDPRDQAMVKETAMPPEMIESFARDVLVTLLASREHREGRFDFSRIAVGRLLRSRFRVDHPEVVPMEFGKVGQARSRAYAREGHTFYGFGSAIDLWIVAEAAVFWQLVSQAIQITYVLDAEPVKAFEELARLVGIPYSIEVKELTGG